MNFKNMENGFNETKGETENNAFSFYEELKEKMKLKEFDSETLYYQLNSFFDACNILVLEGECENFYRENSANYLVKKHCEKDLNYYLEIFKTKANKKDVFLVRGQYNDLDFAFYNFYKAHKLGVERKTIPFSLYLSKKKNQNEYTMKVENKDGQTNYFFYRKPINNKDFSDQYLFSCNRNDFENVFGVIRSFVNDPEYVFFTYKRIILDKPVSLNGREIDAVKNNNYLITNKGKCLVKKQDN